MDIVLLDDDGSIRVGKIPSSPEPQVLVDAVAKLVDLSTLELSRSARLLARPR